MTVTLYTKPACGGCIATKRALEKAKIGYVEAPIEDIREAALEQGIAAAPIVVLPDGTMWGGFRPDRIKELTLTAV